MDPSSKNVPLTENQILANNSTNVNLTVNQFCLVPNRITVTDNQCPATYSTAGTNTDNTYTVEINHSTFTYNQFPATYSTVGTNTDNPYCVVINHYNQCPATYSTAGTNTDNQSIRLVREYQNEIGNNNSSLKKNLDKKREAEASQQNLTNIATTMNNKVNLPVCQCSRHHCKTIKRYMRSLQKHCNQRIQKLESSLQEISERLDRLTYIQITGTFSAVVLLVVLNACRGKSRKRVSVR